MGMAIMGLLPKNAMISGTIRYGDQDLLSASDRTMQQIRGKEIAMISQNSGKRPQPGHDRRRPDCRTAFDPPYLSRQPKHGVKRSGCCPHWDLMSPKQAAGQYPHEFSGGMRERILIALALICNPRLIIADEPTSGLDAQVKSQILHLIKKQIAGNRTLFLITHDMGTASFLCDADRRDVCRGDR